MHFEDLLLCIIDNLIIQKKNYEQEYQNGEWKCTTIYCWDTQNSDNNAQAIYNSEDEYFKYIAYVLCL